MAFRFLHTITPIMSTVVIAPSLWKERSSQDYSWKIARAVTREEYAACQRAQSQLIPYWLEFLFQSVNFPSTTFFEKNGKMVAR
jgi:hypothetical protein